MQTEMLGAGLEPARLAALDPKISDYRNPGARTQVDGSARHATADTDAPARTPNAPRTFHRQFHHRLTGYTALLAAVAAGPAPVRPIGQTGVQPVLFALGLAVRARYSALLGAGEDEGFVVATIGREFALSQRTIAYLCLGARPPRPCVVVRATYAASTTQAMAA